MNMKMIYKKERLTGQPNTDSTVAHYCGPQEEYFTYAHSCFTELPFFSAEHFLALPSSCRLCGVFFCYAKHFLLCWALFCSAKPFPFMLITCFNSISIHNFLLCWALLRAFFGDSKHFSALLIISLLCWAVFPLFQAFFSYMLNIFLLFQAFFHVFYCSAVYLTA